MKKLVKTVFFFLVFGFGCSSVMAANIGTGSRNLLSVTNWGSAGDELLWVQTDGDMASTNPAGCAVTTRYILDSGSSTISKTMLLTALATGKQVNLVLYGAGCWEHAPGDPSTGRPLIIAVDMFP